MRKKLKLSQEELAKLMGITRQSIIRYENGEQMPNSEFKKKLATILNMTNTEMDEKDIFSDYLKDFRAEQQMTQQELADILKISKKTISRYENGDRVPSESTIREITNCLDCFEKKKNIPVEAQGIFPKINREQLGKRINAIRKDRNESLQSFGLCFTNPARKNVVSRWEKGQNIPDIEKLMNIAYLGETTVSAILHGEEYKEFLPIECREFNSFSKLDSGSMGLRLRKIRKDYKLEREEFGKKFMPMINKSSMDRYENGRDIPNTERLVQYAFLGKVSLQFLVYGIR